MGSTKVKFDGNIDVVDTESPAVGHQLQWDGSKWINAAQPSDERVIVFAIEGELEESDDAYGGSRFFYPFASGSLMITKVFAMVSVAPTGSGITAYLRRGKAAGGYNTAADIVIPAGATKDSGGGTIYDAYKYLTCGFYYSLDVDTTGSTTPGKDLTVQVVCTPISIA